MLWELRFWFCFFGPDWRSCRCVGREHRMGMNGAAPEVVRARLNFNSNQYTCDLKMFIIFSLFKLIRLFWPTASLQTHLLRPEVWGQRQPGDHQPAGRLPVRGVRPRHPGPPGLLGEHLRAGHGWPGQPVGLHAQSLPRLRPYGTDPRRRLAAGTSQRQQLQVLLESSYSIKNKQ